MSSGTYVYDKNGNMINDSRRALNLSYNVLNLLSEVKTGNTVKARYSYLADGTKLRVRDAGCNGFDYLGSLTYRKSSAGLELESAHFGSGVIRVNVSNSGEQEVDYFLTDHLGSVRVIVDGNGVVQERNDYYPFGAKHVRGDYPQLSVNRFKYNGKEEQVTGGLGYLDYGVRMYDSELGIWFVGDPFQENFVSLSPYNYCSGNPMIFIDPNGALMTHYVDESYNVILQTNDGSDDVVMVPNNRRQEFDKEVKWYSNSGYLNNSAWNQYWKDELGLAGFQFSDEALRVLDQFNSRWSRDNAARFLLNPTFVNALRMSFSEAMSQWKNPELVAGGLSSGIMGWQGVLKGVARGSKGYVKPYTKSNVRLGQQMHKAYKVGADGIKEFRLPSGRRIDFLDIKNGTIYELKPFNPRAMRQGQKQLQIYMQELQRIPQFRGINWKLILDTY